MRIAVVSSDTSLVTLCQDIVARLRIESCEVVQARAGETGVAGIFVWDLDAVQREPGEGDRAGAHLFLIRRGNLEAFLERYPHARPFTLLKPVSPAALEVFLAHAADSLARPRKGPELAKGGYSDQEALLECLLHASLRLQEFEQDRTNFWARAAHDLRAPLTAASGYCGLLLTEHLGALNSEQRELILRVRRSLDRLSRMASAMFQLTAGRQFDRKYELKRTNIQECIEHSVDEIRFLSAEKNISISVDVTPPGRALYAEPRLLEQVLVNLLENACKFTPRDGSIELRAYPVSWPPRNAAADSRRTGKPGGGSAGRAAYRVDISDSGPGIAPEHLATIFEEYVSYGDTRDRSGGGLGLAICKMILRAHQGEIWAEAGGGGTTLSFVLPLNAPVVREGFEPAACAG